MPMTNTTKRPKLVPGHSYRFTFTPSAEHLARRPYLTPYSTDITIGENGSRWNSRAVHMWASRWCAYGKHTVEIVDITNTTEETNS